MSSDQEKLPATIEEPIVVVHNRFRFLTYLNTFFTAVMTQQVVEEELRVAFKQERGPAISIREFFKANTWKKMSETLKSAGSSGIVKDLGKEFSILGASVLPAAALGYWLFKGSTPTQVEVRQVTVPRSTPSHEPAATSSMAGNHRVQEVLSEGKVSEPQKKMNLT